MELTSVLVGKLDLHGAAVAEAGYWRNLLPPEPWCARVAANPGGFASFVSMRLRSGASNATGTVVGARKGQYSSRPVPILGVAERIAYRALTDYILKGQDLPARTRQEYRDFVAGPMQAAFPDRTRYRLSTAAIEYVVQTDIASFYQYVDHGLLLAELEMRTGKVDESRLLIKLLGEIQGATYGLPQLMHASDQLSEIYMQVLQRDVIRRGYKLWRFNDDMKIAINGYANAQQAMEDVADTGRRLGLTLNEQKSNISKFQTYFWRHFIGSREEGDVEVKPADIDLLIEEYPDIDSAGLIGTATATLDRIGVSGDAGIDLANARIEDVRRLRQAFNILSREGDPSGLRHAKSVFELVPQLTPRVCEYLVACHGKGHATTRVWGSLTKNSTTHNGWQRAWLAYVARETGVTTPTAKKWLKGQAAMGSPDFLYAESCLALAPMGEVTFENLDISLRVRPQALSAWFAVAIGKLPALTQDQKKAVRGSSPLFALLIDS